MSKLLLTTSRPACHPDRKLYLRGLCQYCYLKQRYKENPSLVVSRNERARRYKRQNPEKTKLWSRNWATKYGYTRKLKKYGLTKEEYDQMVRDRGGVCDICKSPPAKRFKHLCVDHCHTTNRVRGLLCNNCNRGLGLMKDSVELLSRAALYLQGS